ncbi:MAG: RnfABCDGE type electron transport complex subunit G [Rhodocyclaceae bacterium]|nr:RnfABCDGE type electron transport complex subunit G [Rhodocyclaceae bacterium]
MNATLAGLRDRLVYQGFSLGVVAMIAAAALAIGNRLTHEAIGQAETADLASSLRQVLPAGMADNDLLADTVTVGVGPSQADAPPVTASGDFMGGSEPGLRARGANKVGAGGTATVTVYRARKAGVPTAAVFRMAERGYAADIVVLMGVDVEGRLLGVRVVKHAETPGLGDKIEIAKAKWVLAFDGKSLGDPPAAKWTVKKDGGVFDQFAGATITPRAVVKAVKTGLEFFAAHREEIVK